MGDPKKLRKKYSTPSHPFQGARIVAENKIAADYGLKNKKEIWKAETQVRSFRTIAKKLQAVRTEAGKRDKQELIARLASLKLVGDGATLDDILGLTVTNLLERRLETIVFKKGLARTMKQARQFILHGLIAVNGRKLTVPSYMVKASEEGAIGYYGKAPNIAPPEAPEPVKAKPAERAPDTKPSVPVPSTRPSVPVKEGSK